MNLVSFNRDQQDRSVQGAMSGNSNSLPTASRGALWKKLALLGAVAGVAVAGWWQFGDALSLESLGRQESRLREFQQQHSVLVYAIACLAYVLVTGLSLPGATVLTLLYGWYFGLVRGVLLVSFASTAGATLAFLLSRFLFRDVIQRRFGDRLKAFDQALAREGPFFLFILRLIPAVPFFVINAVMGLTPLTTRTFWWVSQLGMLPGTVVYVYAGSSVPNLQTLADKGVRAAFTPEQLSRLVIAAVVLGVFPLAVRWVLKQISGTQVARSVARADHNDVNTRHEDR